MICPEQSVFLTQLCVNEKRQEGLSGERGREQESQSREVGKGRGGKTKGGEGKKGQGGSKGKGSVRGKHI